MPPHWWLFKSCQKMLANFFHFKTAFSYYFKHNFLCVHQKVFEGNWQPNGFIMLGKHHNLGGLSAFSRCFWPAPASRRWRLWVHKQGCDAPKTRNIQLPSPAFPNSWRSPNLRDEEFLWAFLKDWSTSALVRVGWKCEDWLKVEMVPCYKWLDKACWIEILSDFGTVMNCIPLFTFKVDFVILHVLWVKKIMILTLERRQFMQNTKSHEGWTILN